MRIIRTILSVAALAAAALTGNAAAAEEAECGYGLCSVRLTPAQLLARAEKLVAEGRYLEARPLIDALAQAPETRLRSRFLSAHVAAQMGDYPGAAEAYKAILADDPNQTRARLELANAMLQLGQFGAADRQFKIAQSDRELSPEVARTIRQVRDIIRSRRAWRLDASFGLAPDSNINGATSADTITVNFGDTPIPLELDERARARSGLGQTATVSAGVRLPLADATTLLVDVDGLGTNYSGKDFDDYWTQAAAGPELRLSEATSLSVQGVGAQRWYGGDVISRQAGARLGFQTAFGDRSRLGLQLDARHSKALFDSNYSGWQAGLYGTFEHALSPALVGSAGIFARRDWLNSSSYSNRELGGTLGLGGELPMGINFGVSGTVSRALYDAPIGFFSLEPRRDWRFSGRATVGNRKLRVFGFSPQIGFTFTRVDASIAFYDNDRSRLTFALARYF